MRYKKNHKHKILSKPVEKKMAHDFQTDLHNRVEKLLAIHGYSKRKFTSDEERERYIAEHS